jgi:hypothetical protein
VSTWAGLLKELLLIVKPYGEHYLFFPDLLHYPFLNSSLKSKEQDDPALSVISHQIVFFSNKAQ